MFDHDALNGGVTIVCFPALFLLIAVALAEAAQRLPLLLLLVVPVVLNGVSHDTYNDRYMHVYDLRPLYASIATTHRVGEPIFSDPSYAAPLLYYYPQLTTDLHSVTVAAPAGAGWYLQGSGAFSSNGADVVVRSGDVIAARVGAAQSAPPQ